MRAVGYNETTDKVQISPYLPDFVADGILKVDFELLRSIGVKHLLIDLDQTLRQAYSRKLDNEVIEFFATLMQKGAFKSVNIVSNNNRNLERYSKPLNARVFQPFWQKGRMIRKPGAKFYLKVLDELGIKPEEAVMIGDKVRLDVAGANRVGIRTVLVRRRGRDYWFDYLMLARWREYRTLAEALHTKSEHLHSTPDYIRSALKKLNISATSVSGPVHLPAGALLFTARDKKRVTSIKVLTRWRSAANWGQRLWRYLKPSWNGEEVPYFGAKHILEHEAYVQQLARDAGVSAPKILGVLDLGDFRFGLASEHIQGDLPDLLPRKQLSEKVLRAIWQQVTILHTARIAHGDLRTNNIIIDTKNQPWITNFDLAVSTAPRQKMRRDIIELLVSLALTIGARDSVDAAFEVAGRDTMSKIQPDLAVANLSHHTRISLRGHHNLHLLEEIDQYLVQRLAKTL